MGYPTSGYRANQRLPGSQRGTARPRTNARRPLGDTRTRPQYTRQQAKPFLPKLPTQVPQAPRGNFSMQSPGAQFARRAAAMAFTRAARNVMNLHPYVRLFNFAWDAGQLLDQWWYGSPGTPAQPAYHRPPEGWVVYKECFEAGSNPPNFWHDTGGICTGFSGAVRLDPNSEYVRNFGPGAKIAYSWDSRTNTPIGGVGRIYTKWMYEKVSSTPGPITPGVDVPAVPATPPQFWPLATPLGAPGTPAPSPLKYPSQDPFTDPANLPYSPLVSPTPVPVPWHIQPARQPNPYRSPSERTRRGNNPQVRPYRANSVGIPYGSIVVTPNGVTQRPTPHVRQPPKRNEKEKKVHTLGSAGRAVSKAFHGLTEFNDFIESAYDALPESLRLKYRPGDPITSWEKALHVAKHWDDIDAVEFVKNVVQNHYEDKLVGGLNKGVGDRTRRSGGLPVGLGYGPAM